MRDIARVIARNRLLSQTQEQLDDAADFRDPVYSSNQAAVYRASCRRHENVLYVMGRDRAQRRLLAVAPKDFRTPFKGKASRMEGMYAQEIEMNPANAARLQELFPFLVPTTGNGTATSIGFGDRLGYTSPAHLRVAKKYNLFPIVAQQSTRELEALGRTFEQVTADAVFAVFQEGYTAGFGADGDHLRSMSEVRNVVKSSPSMLTIDISDFLPTDAAAMDNRSLQETFRKLPRKEQQRIRRTYSGRSFNLGSVSVRFRPGDAERAAIKFLAGMDFAQKAWDRLRKQRGDAAVEFTVDEIPVVSSLVDHYFIANEFRNRGVNLYSIALRFPGAMHKGVDYDGDVRAFDREFSDHVAIAEALGGHKVSVHSGSDKFAIYPTVGRRSGGRFHLKTSGTSWLVAMQTVAETAPDFYREIHRKAMDVFPEMQAKYEITADINQVPDLDSLRDRQLLDLFSNPHWRQLLHISYGGILSDADLASRIRDTLHVNEDAYFTNISRHFTAHLDSLGVEKRS